MKKRHPVVLLGFDAAEASLVDALINEGKMPRLAALRQKGRWGRIYSDPAHFLSLVWSTFFTSSRLEQHGWYFNKIWRQERQCIEWISPKWLPQKTFWSHIEDRYRIALLDVPYVVGVPHGSNCETINGWQNHDHFGVEEKPKGLWKELQEKYGKSFMTPERFGDQTPQTLLSLRQEVLNTIGQFADITIDFIKRERWDLLLAVFGGAHRGTHYLWNLSQIDTKGVSQETLDTLENAREEIYKALDEALGRVLEVVPRDTTVMAFALHGMGPNLGWYEYLPSIVDHVHNYGRSKPQKRGMLFKIKKALPWKLVRQVTRRIPHRWNVALVPLWSRRMYDWSKTRYFCIPMDYNGYIRFNIRGREAEGIVEPEQVAEETRKLETALKSFRDIENGRPIVKRLIPIEELIGKNAPQRAVLPDLVVLWEADFPTSVCSGVRSEEYGEVRWQRGAKLDSGRSGNHTTNGWFAVAGPGIEPGKASEAIDSIDMAPTILDWMGAPENGDLIGRVIEELRRKQV